MRSIIGSLLLVGAGLWLYSAAPAQAEVVHLVPEEKASWRLKNLFSWVRPRHSYGERKIEVRTTPPGATLDLFYVRANFQKLYEQAVAPATLKLPKRAEAGPRDAVTIRAFLPGYRQEQVSIRVSDSRDHVLLELDPLPNTLRAVAYTHFAGRASLAFLTDESLTVRVQERGYGFNVVLTETGPAPEADDAFLGLRGPFIDKVDSVQLGEDLLVRVELAKAARGTLDLRSRRFHDAIRDLYSYTIDLVPDDGGVAAVERARAALSRITSQQVTGCSALFDETLRSQLDPASLSRALAPRGAFTDPYMRAAMKRLGEVSPGGVITLLDGTQLHPQVPIELAAATSQAAQARGYLVLLRYFVRELEPGNQTTPVLRSLIAPEMSPARFEEALARAEAAERACRSRSAAKS